MDSTAPGSRLLKQIASEMGVHLTWHESAIGLKRQHDWERAGRGGALPRPRG